MVEGLRQIRENLRAIDAKIQEICLQFHAKPQRSQIRLFGLGLMFSILQGMAVLAPWRETISRKAAKAAKGKIFMNFMFVRKFIGILAFFAPWRE